MKTGYVSKILSVPLFICIFNVVGGLETETTEAKEHGPVLVEVYYNSFCLNCVYIFKTLTNTVDRLKDTDIMKVNKKNIILYK
jgi:hypothetical protein